ncbi:MAG: hypothetical protein A2Z25_22420 [Planctomycetes bacterium RBG_16_55_9]|nr:MAG: hypothetical protein A2Z25_22420 [Planctomycetes bacterium RBG_16_55_9]
MRQLIYLTLILAAAAVLWLSRSSPHFAIGAAVTPGPLTRAHAQYERDCSQCHSPFNEEVQNDLCVLCHDKVKEDLEKRRGFHGRCPSVMNKTCKSCHTEHVGRDGSIVSFDERTFDHEFTDFRLTGAHARASAGCEACHAKDKKFRDSPTDCLGCHSDDDKHQSRLGADCATCHTETVWDETSFDHDTTCFSLKGGHREAACDSCHLNKVYLNASSQCNSCHLMNDVHDSGSQEKCDRCHSSENWQDAVFDHDRETQFVLENRHAELGCDACHPGFTFRKSPGVQCVDCHGADDIHKGKVGSLCDDCHPSVKWNQVSFDHNKDTQFNLSGRHVNVPCTDCHKESPLQRRPAAMCHNCHQADDVHKGQLDSACDSCHNTNGWKEQVAFDHDLTRFPLIGLHAVVACGECHLSSTFKQADVTCASCHKSEDYHKGTLGSECAGCHNPNGWRLWQFDHGVQTDFKLEGAHARLECRACHVSQTKGNIWLSPACSSCHLEDDVHSRRFGKQCNRCHTAESFRRIKMGN